MKVKVKFLINIWPYKKGDIGEIEEKKANFLWDKIEIIQDKKENKIIQKNKKNKAILKPKKAKWL